MENKVILYTTHCPMCRVLKTKLDKNKIDYEVCEDVQVMIDKGFTHSPVLEVNGAYLTMKDAMKWTEENKCI